MIWAGTSDCSECTTDTETDTARMFIGRSMDMTIQIARMTNEPENVLTLYE
jgi:hypothetical protein